MNLKTATAEIARNVQAEQLIKDGELTDHLQSIIHANSLSLPASTAKTTEVVILHTEGFDSRAELENLCLKLDHYGLIVVFEGQGAGLAYQMTQNLGLRDRFFTQVPAGFEETPKTHLAKGQAISPVLISRYPSHDTWTNLASDKKGKKGVFVFDPITQYLQILSAGDYAKAYQAFLVLQPQYRGTLELTDYIDMVQGNVNKLAAYAIHPRLELALQEANRIYQLTRAILRFA